MPHLLANAELGSLVDVHGRGAPAYLLARIFPASASDSHPRRHAAATGFASAWAPLDAGKPRPQQGMTVNGSWRVPSPADRAMAVATRSRIAPWRSHHRSRRGKRAGTVRRRITDLRGAGPRNEQLPAADRRTIGLGRAARCRFLFADRCARRRPCRLRPAVRPRDGPRDGCAAEMLGQGEEAPPVRSRFIATQACRAASNGRDFITEVRATRRPQDGNHLAEGRGEVRAARLARSRRSRLRLRAGDRHRRRLDGAVLDRREVRGRAGRARAAPCARPFSAGRPSRSASSR